MGFLAFKITFEASIPNQQLTTHLPGFRGSRGITTFTSLQDVLVESDVDLEL